VGPEQASENRLANLVRPEPGRRETIRAGGLRACLFGFQAARKKEEAEHGGHLALKIFGRGFDSRRLHHMGEGGLEERGRPWREGKRQLTFTL
jgi:hypothetical protein